MKSKQQWIVSSYVLCGRQLARYESPNYSKYPDFNIQPKFPCEYRGPRLLTQVPWILSQVVISLPWGAMYNQCGCGCDHSRAVMNRWATRPWSSGTLCNSQATRCILLRRPGLDVNSVCYNILLLRLIYLVILHMLILDSVPESRIRGLSIFCLVEKCRAIPSTLRSV